VKTNRLRGDDGVGLKGVALTRFRRPPRQYIVYLHGVADNRTSSTGVIERFGRLGFDVIAYDSRAHGDSERRRLHLRILRTPRYAMPCWTPSAPVRSC